MEKALFLYNGCSGKGRIDREAGAIAGILGAAGYRVETLPVDFASNPFDGRPGLALVAVAGGDGTVNYVVNRMKERGLDVPLGVIPAGTANDFAGAIGMSHDPLEAARQIVGGQLERIDCGRVNGLHFVNIFSFGLFTTTSQRTPDERKHRLGKLAYILEGVKELRRLHGVPLEVETDRDRFRIDALMMLVFNGETARGIPPCAALERPGRSFRLHPAREAGFSPLGLGDGALPAGGQSPAGAAPAHALARNRLAARRADRRGRAARRPVSAADRVPAR